MNSLVIIVTSSTIIALYGVILIILIGILDEVKAIRKQVRKNNSQEMLHLLESKENKKNK